MKLSLIVPCYNEAENVAAFQAAVIHAFENCGFDYEIIFIDDGSRDATLHNLRKLYAAQGKAEEEQQAYETAAVYKAAVSEISLFRALALKKLGQDAEAQRVLEEMLSAGENLIVNKDLRTYYGVGSPSPMPFENAIEKKNLVDGSILKAFALLGLGDGEAAETAMNVARELDPHDFRIFAFDRIK